MCTTTSTVQSSSGRSPVASTIITVTGSRNASTTSTEPSPSSSVDPAVEAAILRGLRSADLGATVVVVAYRRATIALADEVVWIERGRVVDRGTHEELIGRTPGYALLVNAYDDEAERRAGLVGAEEAAR